MSPWRITSWVCAAVVIGSVLACIWMASRRSAALVAVTVTALNPNDEPADLVVPLVNPREALPDYELVVMQLDGNQQYLGTRPDESAAKGLTWRLAEPLAVTQIAAVRLREKDKLVSDAIAEVQVQGKQVEAKGYRFDFGLEHSADVGIKAFFSTPIGMAISAAFFVGVLVLVLSRLAV
jgi:hypothetical protein